ncbi:MAG: amidase [Solirubrobacterales bacterium]
MSDEPATMDATAQAELVRSGKASPAELVDAAIGRVEALNGELNAVIHPLFDRARAQAAGDVPDGPFRGVPMLHKDLGAHYAGEPYHEGIKHLRDLGWEEPRESWLAARFRAAGLVSCGKTNTPELGILPTTEPEAHGPSRNPWDTSRSTGGSSGGSAAAVAAGMVPVAHANDGGGSIRIPASACGLVGLKPSRARTTLGPDLGEPSSAFVCEHVVTHSVRDSAAILDATHGPGPGDPYVAPPPERPYADELVADPGGLRIGVMTSAPAGLFEVDPDCVTAARQAGALLESLGHGVDESHPDALDDPEYIDRFVARWCVAIASNLEYWSLKSGKPVTAEGVEASTWALGEIGRGYGAVDLLGIIAYQQGSARAAAEWWESGFDLLLTPTLGEPPPPLGSFGFDPDEPEAFLRRAVPTAGFTAYWNATGQPAISLPLHWSDEGLPIGVQLVAAYGREDLLLRVAAQLEQAQPWAERTPPLFAGAPA